MIFVTGGTGLVGSHLMFELISAGKEVRALKRATSDLNQVLKVFSYYSAHAKDLFNKIEWVDGDMLDYFSLEKILEGVTEIFHCAAIISFERKERKKMISNNVTGTANLVNAALQNGVKKICHVSSVAGLGRYENGDIITEETNWSPSKKASGYSVSKFFSETEIWRGIEEGLDAVIVNPSIIFGPANWESGSAKMFKAIWNGMKFYTEGTTGFVDVKDVTRAMINLMDDSNFERCKNQRYILSSENLSYKTVFDQIAGALEKPGPTIFASDLMLGIAWRVAAVIGFVSGKPSFITRDSVSGSNKSNKFDGGKIMRTIDFNYLAISDSIKQTATILKSEMQTQKAL
jgi:dihydroflavonol-4-reductase